MLLAGTLLAFSLFGAGCKQSNGDSCEVASDCESNFCLPGGGTPNSFCCDQNNLAACGSGTGPGGAQGSIGGNTGSGGAEGTGGAGGAASDASSDGAGDAASTD
jgi:hypothetical protein